MDLTYRPYVANKMQITIELHNAAVLELVNQAPS